MAIRKQIADLRKEKNMTQEELAEQVHVSRQAVTKWESGESVPELSKLIMLADLFGVSLDRLVGRNKTNFDIIVAHLERYSFVNSFGNLDYDEAVKQIVNRYLSYMQQHINESNMTAEQIIDCLLYMLGDNSDE